MLDDISFYKQHFPLESLDSRKEHEYNHWYDKSYTNDCLWPEAEKESLESLARGFAKSRADGCLIVAGSEGSLQKYYFNSIFKTL